MFYLVPKKYEKGSLNWALMTGDWEDLTVSQIAEVLDEDKDVIKSRIYEIKKKTGFDIPRKRARRGVKEAL